MSEGCLYLWKIHTVEMFIPELPIRVIFGMQLMLQTHDIGDETSENCDLALIGLFAHCIADTHPLPFG